MSEIQTYLDVQYFILHPSLIRRLASQESQDADRWLDVLECVYGILPVALVSWDFSRDLERLSPPVFPPCLLLTPRIVERRNKHVAGIIITWLSVLL